MKAGRVLHISNFFPPDDIGGAEIAAYNSCHGLLGARRGLDVSVLVVNARGPVRDRHYQLNGVAVHDVGLARRGPAVGRSIRDRLRRGWADLYDRRVADTVTAELGRLRPDLVHVHNVSGTTMAPFLVCRRLGVPVVLTLHDYWLLCPNNMLYGGDGLLCRPADRPGWARCGRCFRRYDFWADIPARRSVLAWLVRDVKCFMAPSRRLVDLHVAAGYDSARFRVVPYGIEPGLAHLPANPIVRKIAREAGRAPTLLFAGSLVVSKGIQVLTEALPRLLDAVPGLRLVVAGGGEERLVAPLRRLGRPAVWLLGRLPCDEMRLLYAAADLTLVPSTWYDNSPMVIYESLLAGTPVVGSAIGGIPELIQEGLTGYLFPPGDAEALAGRVMDHFDRPAPERREMRRRCARYIRQELSAERHVERLLAVYDLAWHPAARAGEVGS